MLKYIRKIDIKPEESKERTKFMEAIK